MIVTCAVILGVVALIEVVTIFFRMPVGNNSPAYVTILPVFREDDLFPLRLEKLALKSGGRSFIIIVNYSADKMQSELCIQFCRDNPDTIMVHHSELENLLSKTFAFSDKM